MKIFEVEDNFPGATPKPAELLGLVQFLDGRAEDTGAKKQISVDAFINLAQSLDINVTRDNVADIVGQPPLSQVLEPMEPGAASISFKSSGEQYPTEMPVNKAQDIVATAAKSAMKKDRNLG
jgi:hypothetical protein